MTAGGVSGREVRGPDIWAATNLGKGPVGTKGATMTYLYPLGAGVLFIAWMLIVLLFWDSQFEPPRTSCEPRM
jgi:hypothetical protein